MKKTLLFTLLLLLVGFAWADTYIIGTGTSASGLYPIYGYYDYSWSKQIYTAAEINAAGLNDAEDITGIGLYVGNTPANFVMADQRIYMRHSAATTYTTVTDETGTGYPDNTTFEQVFQGTLTFNGGGWIYITFDNPFAWNNTDNIEILWENYCLNGVTGYPTFRYTSQSPDYRNVYKYQDGTFPAVAGTRSTSRPNITIVTPSVDPPSPAILGYPANGSYAFLDGILSWGDGGGMPTSYDVYLDTTDGSTLVSDDQVGTTYTPTLSPGTTYYWKVVPSNANGPATGVSTWSFSTPTADQIAESFDDTAFPPVGWTTPGGAFARSTTTPFYGAASAYEFIAAGPSYLHTTLLEITATSELDWWMRTSTTTGIGRVQVVYSTDGATWNDIGAEISLPTETTWMNYNVDLSSLAGNNYMIGFKVYSSTTSSSSFYIDHVIGPEFASVVPGPPSLTAPADLATDVSELTSFSWSGPTTGGVPTGYNLYLDTVDGSTLLASDVSSPYSVSTPLAYNTTYYWTVKAYNGAGTGDPAPVRSFTTRQDPTIYTLPWIEDFGTTGTTFPPTNWTRSGGVLADPTTLVTGSLWVQDNWLNDTTVTPVNYSARMNIYSTSRYGWIITPPIQMPGAGYQLEFDMGLTDYGNGNVPDVPSPDDRFIVLIGDGVTWTPANILREYNNTGSPYVYDTIPNTGEHLVFPLDAYTGIKYIAFYGESTVSNADNDFFVDNVMIRQTPAGAPDHVTLVSPVDGAVDLAPDNVLLNWNPALTGGTAAYYEVYVGVDPIDPGNDYYGEFFYETTNAFLDLSAQGDIDLGFSTTWYWAVLPYNSENLAPDPDTPDFMVWDFTTAPDPTIVALPYEEYFDSVTAPVLPYGWSAYINSTSTSAFVGTYSSTTYAQSAPNSVRLYNPSDAAADLRLITPLIDLGRSLNQIKVKFYARSSSAGYPLLVGSVSTVDGTGVFTELQSIALTTTQTEYEVSFADYLGTDQYICFKHGLGGTSRSLYVDNVRLLELLANDLAATAVSNPGIMTAGTAYDFMVDVFNEGTATQSAYTVKLMSVDTRTELASLDVTTPLDPASTTQHTLSWTPAAGGVFQVYGKVVLAGDGNAANDETPVTEAYVLDNTMTVIPVGDDDTTLSVHYLPLDFYYKNSVGEVLYFPDEMHLQSGTISAVVYKNTFLSNLTGKPVKIWMAHTTASDLTGGWLPALDYTLVFDGVVDFPSGVNYILIPLTTPYSFTGGTLAVRTNRPFDTAYFSSSDKFFYTTNPDHTNRGRYLYSDSVTYDPLAPSAAGTAVGYAPNTSFVVQNAVMQTGAILNGYVYETGTTNPIEGATVTLADERYAATTDATGFYEFTFWEAHTVTASAAATDYYDSTPVTGIALTMGNTVSQNLFLEPLPNLTVSGNVTSNDYPGGIAGATVKLFGYHNYEATTVIGGMFDIPNVKGNSAGSTYTYEVSKEGYATVNGSITVYAAPYVMDTVNLVEHLWPAYNLVATHDAGAVDLVWDPAGAPDYIFFDFEDDNGGWVGSGYGDWEWTNTYTLTGYVDNDTYVDTPPTAPYSGTGLWGTKVLGSHSNSSAWSYLRQTFDLSVFDSPVLSLWHYMNGYNTWDYGLIKVNGTTVWGSSALAVFMPWQELAIDLSAYGGMAGVEISFEWYATSVVDYAGWYIDDIYIGPATRAQASLGTRNGTRMFVDYDVYRFLAADEANPGVWTLVSGNITNPMYTDATFQFEPEGRYKWAVKANYSGSLVSEPVISNSLGRLGDLQDIVATTLGADVVLNWTAQPGATYYKVYAADDPYGTFTYLGFSQTNSYTVTAPASAMKFYKVTAIADEALPGRSK